MLLRPYLLRALLSSLLLAAGAWGATPPNCNFTLTPLSVTVPAQGGAGQINLSVSSSDCTRTAISSVDWITISFGQTGSGDGSVGYTVKANPLGVPRQGTITVNAQTFTVTQDAAACGFALTPVSQSVPMSGGAFSFKVATSCQWTATASDPWITISPPMTATGNGTVSFSVTANTNAANRNGSITVGSVSFPISQAGAGCVVTLSSPGISVAATAQNGSFTVTANVGCTISALPDVPWITALVNGSTITYSVAANASGQTRSGNIVVGSQKFLITQAGASCAYVVSPETVAIPTEGGSGKVSVTTGIGCTWSVQNRTAFVENLAPTSSSGSGTVSFTVGPDSAGAGRTGILLVAGITVTITQAPLTKGIQISSGGIVNGASFAGGSVAPGEILSIFGSGLGPAIAVPLQLTGDGQSLTTSLAGTRVLFDGTAAPMIFTSAGQVSAIAPYSIDGKQSTMVQVEYQGIRSDPVSVNIAPAAPAIFTLSASGSGQGAVLNQDFSVNGPANPAAANSILMIYATGEGATNPAGMDGLLTGASLPRPVQPVAVQIGGIDAEVLYAGGAPGLVAGLVQVNVRLPAGVSGAAVPVLLSVGGVASSGIVTVAVQ